ncbi:hypothetical protein [Streptomyces sp. NPDC052042]|uniref:hypothetical protein n=1 Tax=Streptomyces sp. NPDC052042 TaxID=3365683 RepID=UPI0037CDDB26
MTQIPHREKNTDFRSRARAAVAAKSHRAIVFDDIAEVSVGSTGYFTPSQRNAVCTAAGWFSDGVAYRPGEGEKFTSHSGPANDERLVELILAASVPEHRTDDEPSGASADGLDPDTVVPGSSLVQWKVDSDEDVTPAQAALDTWREHFGRDDGRPPNEECCVFTVVGEHGRSVVIDLSDERYAHLFP